MSIGSRVFHSRGSKNRGIPLTMRVALQQHCTAVQTVVSKYEYYKPVIMWRAPPSRNAARTMCHVADISTRTVVKSSLWMLNRTERSKMLQRHFCCWIYRLTSPSISHWRIQYITVGWWECFPKSKSLGWQCKFCHGAYALYTWLSRSIIRRLLKSRWPVA